MPAFLLSTATRLILAFGVVAGLLAVILWYRSQVLEHEATIAQQRLALAQNAATLEAERANAHRNELALTQAATAMAERLERMAATRRIIQSTPTSTACVVSPAMSAAVGSLRRNRNSGSGASAVDTRVSAGVPRSARAPSR